ncbi:hypothetical protein NL676_024868 [Syzygium grande]|nr:hypothetical protein NL676_024868 [Syzygium grande]
MPSPSSFSAEPSRHHLLLLSLPSNSHCNISDSGLYDNAVANGIEALIEGLYVEAIKAGGGPSPGGKCHGSSGVTFKNSVPIPGNGH